MVLQQLAQVLCDQGDYEEAGSSFAEASDIVQASFGIYHPYLARLRVTFGTCLTKLGRYQAAEEQIVAAVGVLRTALGDGDRQTNRAIQSLAALYEAWGKPEKAAEYRALLEETEKALPRPQ